MHILLDANRLHLVVGVYAAGTYDNNQGLRAMVAFLQTRPRRQLALQPRKLRTDKA